MTRFDLFGKMSYIMKRNIGHINLKPPSVIVKKSTLEMMFDELERNRNFISNPLLESLRRYKFNYKGTHVSITTDNQMGSSKQELLEKLSIFSVLKNMR